MSLEDSKERKTRDQEEEEKLRGSQGPSQRGSQVEVAAPIPPKTIITNNIVKVNHPHPHRQPYPLNPGEYDVMLPCDSPIAISRNKHGQVVFVRHHRSTIHHGRLSTAERYGFVRHKGDVIVSVAGYDSQHATCEQVMKLMKEGWKASFQSENQRDRGLLHIRFLDCTYQHHTRQLPLEAERQHLHHYIAALRSDISKRKRHLEYLENFVHQKEGELEAMMKHDLQWMERKKDQSLRVHGACELKKRSHLAIHFGTHEESKPGEESGDSAMKTDKRGLVSPSCSYEETDEKSKRARYEENVERSVKVVK